MKILLVGSSGHLGSKLEQALRTEPCVQLVATGRKQGLDVLNPDLPSKIEGNFDWIIDNVSGYKAGGFPRPQSDQIAKEGHLNLARFAQSRGTRVLLIGVLGSDLVGASVPHFYEKRIAEEAYRSLGVPCVSVRPGMFLDQADGRIEKNLMKGVYQHLGSPDVRFAVTQTRTVIETVLRVLKDGVHGPFEIKEVGRNTTARELANDFSKERRAPVKVQAVPLVVFNILTALPRIFSPGVRNLHGMIEFMNTGQFVASGKSSQGAQSR